MSEQELVLAVQHVTSGYRAGGVFRKGPYQEVLHDVTFDVRHGEILGLVGESGTGKSTLAKTILGIVRPDAGQVIHYTKRPQMIFQDPYSSLNPAYTVSWILEEPLRIYGKYDATERKRRVRDMLERVELPEECLEARPSELSGGQRQRVGIAQALLGDPPFLIFDEPTVGLDPEERIHFRNLFSRTAQDRLVLLSTHIIEDVQSVCDQIVVIHHGQIRFTGTPEQLIASAAGHVGVFWEKDETQEQGLHITARVNTSQGVRCRAVADQLPPYVQAEEPTLEDAYLYLISREAAQ